MTNDKDKFDKITDAHVSIARLKYLIQDYFVIIMEYNDEKDTYLLENIISESFMPDSETQLWEYLDKNYN